MGFWSRFWDGLAGITPNDNGPANYRPGDPEGFEYDALPATENRSLPLPWSSPFDGWPSDWQTPNWQQVSSSIDRLVDIAWACLDLNSNIVSSMPVYRLKDGRIIEPKAWMLNPDPTIYTCWQEFAKQLFWDFQMGEAFVLPITKGSDTYPSAFRVIPPWLVNVEMNGGFRSYRLGGETGADITDDVLHIRYSSNTADARGHGPLEIAGARQVTIRLLQKYTTTLAETGGVPLYWMELARHITESEGRDLMERWIESRAKNAGQPALVGGGATLHQARTMDAKEMGLLEISQFSESRIAVLLGVPPFLVGLAGASGSLTYSNIADLFDFHDRSSLRPKSRMIMESLSAWALPRGQAVELNRDDYTRLPMNERAAVYKTLIDLGILTPEEVRIMERFYGSAQVATGGNTVSADTIAAQALTGGTN